MTPPKFTLSPSDLTFFYEKRNIICVKEDLLRKSPNSLKRTFLNANIQRLHPNLNFCSTAKK